MALGWVRALGSQGGVPLRARGALRVAADSTTKIRSHAGGLEETLEAAIHAAAAGQEAFEPAMAALGHRLQTASADAVGWPGAWGSRPP